MNEVNKAIKKGYQILKIYEVWHFEKCTNQMFCGYIKRFLKIKLETSSHTYKDNDEYKRIVCNRYGI